MLSAEADEIGSTHRSGGAHSLFALPPPSSLGGGGGGGAAGVIADVAALTTRAGASTSRGGSNNDRDAAAAAGSAAATAVASVASPSASSNGSSSNGSSGGRSHGKSHLASSSASGGGGSADRTARAGSTPRHTRVRGVGLAAAAASAPNNNNSSNSSSSSSSSSTTVPSSVAVAAAAAMLHRSVSAVTLSHQPHQPLPQPQQQQQQPLFELASSHSKAPVIHRAATLDGQSRRGDGSVVVVAADHSSGDDDDTAAARHGRYARTVVVTPRPGVGAVASSSNSSSSSSNANGGLRHSYSALSAGHGAGDDSDDDRSCQSRASAKARAKLQQQLPALPLSALNSDGTSSGTSSSVSASSASPSATAGATATAGVLSGAAVSSCSSSGGSGGVAPLHHSPLSPSNSGGAGSGSSDVLKRYLAYACAHAVREKYLFGERWGLFALWLFVQYLHVVAMNAAYYMHLPREPLWDVGFAWLPFAPHGLPDLLAHAMLAVTALFVLTPFVRALWATRTPVFTALMVARFCTVLILSQALRVVTFIVTTLPGPSEKCRPDSPLYQPPRSLYEVFTTVHGSGSGVGGVGCGDLVFSSGMIWVVLCALTLDHYSSSDPSAAAVGSSGNSPIATADADGTDDDNEGDGADPESQPLTPSGEDSDAAGAAAATTVAAPRVSLGRKVFRLALVLYVTAFGVSQVAARTHYTLDVLVAGYTVPLLWVACLRHLPDRVPWEFRRHLPLYHHPHLTALWPTQCWQCDPHSCNCAAAAAVLAGAKLLGGGGSGSSGSSVPPSPYHLSSPPLSAAAGTTVSPRGLVPVRP